MRKSTRAKKWQTALLMRLVFGAKTRASQEKVLKKLNSLGLHPEGFVPNPFAVIKEVIFDIYYAQRDLQDILKAWKEGGFNSTRERKLTIAYMKNICSIITRVKEMQFRF